MDFIDLKLIFARLTNNKFGKSEDVHGRKYRDVYKRYGHAVMKKDYLDGNSWGVK